MCQSDLFCVSDLFFLGETAGCAAQASRRSGQAVYPTNLIPGRVAAQSGCVSPCSVAGFIEADRLNLFAFRSSYLLDQSTWIVEMVPRAPRSLLRACSFFANRAPMRSRSRWLWLTLELRASSEAAALAMAVISIPVDGGGSLARPRNSQNSTSRACLGGAASTAVSSG